jgi:hypothetical protein
VQGKAFDKNSQGEAIYVLLACAIFKLYIPLRTAHLLCAVEFQMCSLIIKMICKDFKNTTEFLHTTSQFQSNWDAWMLTANGCRIHCKIYCATRKINFT